MNSLEILKTRISERYHLLKGQQEAISLWDARMIYSYCAMVGYASLWDDSEEDTVSIRHVKQRINRVFKAYSALFSNLRVKLPDLTSNDLADEIVAQYIYTSVVYHKAGRLTWPKWSTARCGSIIFERGRTFDRIGRVSGIGFYRKDDSKENSKEWNSAPVRAMFRLERANLQEIWEQVLSTAVWRSINGFSGRVEYLQLKPPFWFGYWKNTSDPVRTASILRTGDPGRELYYLYRYRNEALEISALPQWRVEGSEYRTLACACLSAHSTLPPIQFSVDKNIVHIHLEYLLPPREMNFLKLYSWPDFQNLSSSDFSRVVTVDIFPAIKAILEDEGYEFIKMSERRGNDNAKRC